MAYRRSDEDDLAYGERWNPERLAHERDRLEERERERDRDRDRDQYFSRAPPRESPREAPTRERVREASVDERFRERRAPRPWEVDDVSQRRFYDEAPRRRPSPPPELEKALYHDKGRAREHRDSPPPPRRPPGLLRRQSSLDTFDRRPAQRLYDRDRDRGHDREEHEPPSRRGGYRPDPYEPIPLPRSRALPPPRMYAENDYDEIKVAEPQRFGDDDFHAYPGEHVLEREIVRTRDYHDRSPSRASKASRHRSRSRRESVRSSSTSSGGSDTGGTTVTAKSEYPKKGKTRIPSRLVSIRAIVELQYPYVIEGHTIIIQKALGQKNIDDLLKLSEDYKKADAELVSARSVPGPIVEEHREEEFTIPPPAPPSLIRAPPPPPVEYVKEMMVREVSPVRSYTSYNTASSSAYTTSRTPVVIEAEPRGYGGDVLAGPLALVGDRRGDRHHQRHSQHGHSHSLDRHSHSLDRELVRAERLPTGELVLYEEQVERVEEPRRGVRIEKDKKR